MPSLISHLSPQQGRKGNGVFRHHAPAKMSENSIALKDEFPRVYAGTRRW